MTKIYTFGDGFATGHIWPEWPQILAALLPEYEVINTAGVGAGVEWLVHKFVDTMPKQSYVIFQWPPFNVGRFDKLIQDTEWQKIADSDEVYNFNQYQDKDEKWWLSSASTNSTVKHYHTTYIQNKQYQARFLDYKTLVKNTLENNNCNYVFTSTDEQNKFSYKEQFKYTRQNEIQPSPIVHFEWLLTEILPLTNIDYDKNRAGTLKDLIASEDWQPYYWDRSRVWENLSSNLNQQNI